MEIKARGIIISSKKFELHKHTVEVLSKIGKWKGIYSAKTTSPILGSEGIFVWKGRSASSLGNISFEIIKSSKVVLFWNEPLVIAAIACISSSAAKFIPERIEAHRDYNKFTICINNINSSNYLEKLFEWETYLIGEYFGQEVELSNLNIDGLKDHCNKTSEVATKERNDFVKLFMNNIYR